MSRSRLVLVLTLLALAACAPLRLEARVERPRSARRVVVVHPGWPIRRAPRHVVVHPERRHVRIVPRLYLAPMMFMSVVVTVHPDHERIVWEDGETIDRADDWCELVLDCDTRGHGLWYEVEAGRVQVEWAEVVFEDGSAQVVDFESHTQGPGLYRLLELHDDRHVDHVRMVVRSRTPESRIVLRMEK